MGALARLLALSLALVALVSCASVTFDQQEVAFDRDPATDSLLVELVYHDVGAIAHERRAFLHLGELSDGPDVYAAASFVQAVAAGEPTFVLLWPFRDLDLTVLLPTDEQLGGEPVEVRELVTWLRGVRVVEARVERDDAGRIDLYQRISVPDLSVGIERVNRLLQAFLLGEHQESSLATMTELEAASYGIALDDARAGRDWLSWGDGGLVLRIPLDSRHLVALLGDLLTDLDRDLYRMVDELDENGLAEVSLSLSVLRELVLLATDLRVEADHLVLTLGDAEGDLALTLGPDLDGRLGLEDFRPALGEELERRGLSLPSRYALPE